MSILFTLCLGIIGIENIKKEWVEYLPAILLCLVLLDAFTIITLFFE